MTLVQILALKTGDVVGYRNHIGDLVQKAAVIKNDPLVPGKFVVIIGETEGRQEVDMPGLLVVQTDADGRNMTWIPENFPLGIPQLSDASRIGSADVPWQ